MSEEVTFSNPLVQSESKPASVVEESTTPKEAAQQPLFYEDTHFRLRVTPTPPARVLFEIECSPKYAGVLFDEALAAIRHHVSIPGFRKGKAPNEHVLKCYRPAVEQEHKRLLREKGIAFATSQSGYLPLVDISRLKIDIEMGKPGTPPFMRCLCDAMPPSPHIDLETLRTHIKPTARAEVTQTDKDEALHRLQLFHATWKTKEEPAASGDRLRIEALNPDQQKIFKSLHWDVIELNTRTLTVPWAANLLGAKVNEERECFAREQTQFPEDLDLYPSEATSIPVRILEIQEPVLHPADDALAQKAGCKDIAQLLERIQANLETRAFYNLMQQRAAELKIALTEQYPLSIPIALVYAQVELRRPILDAAGLPKKEHEQLSALEPLRARSLLHVVHLLQRWMNDQKINITQEDFLEELKHQQSETNPSELMIHNKMAPETVRRQIIILLTLRLGLYNMLKQLYPGEVE